MSTNKKSFLSFKDQVFDFKEIIFTMNEEKKNFFNWPNLLKLYFHHVLVIMYRVLPFEHLKNNRISMVKFSIK